MYFPFESLFFLRKYNPWLDVVAILVVLWVKGAFPHLLEELRALFQVCECSEYVTPFTLLSLYIIYISTYILFIFKQNEYTDYTILLLWPFSFVLIMVKCSSSLWNRNSVFKRVSNFILLFMIIRSKYVSLLKSQ